MEISWDDSHGEPGHKTVSFWWLGVSGIPMTGWHVQSIYSNNNNNNKSDLPGLLVNQSPIFISNGNSTLLWLSQKTWMRTKNSCETKHHGNCSMVGGYKQYPHSCFFLHVQCISLRAKYDFFCHGGAERERIMQNRKRITKHQNNWRK